MTSNLNREVSFRIHGNVCTFIGAKKYFSVRRDGCAVFSIGVEDVQVKWEYQGAHHRKWK